MLEEGIWSGYMRTTRQYYLPNNEKKTSHFCLTSQLNTTQWTNWGNGDNKSLFAFSFIAMTTGTDNYKYSSNNIISMFEEFELILTLGQHCWMYRANKNIPTAPKEPKTSRDNEGGAPSTCQTLNPPPDPVDVLTVLSWSATAPQRLTVCVRDSSCSLFLFTPVNRLHHVRQGPHKYARAQLCTASG